MTTDQNQPEKSICIGKIATVHGLKGLVKILPYCEDLSLLESIEAFKITLKNKSGKYILAAIEGISSREEAEALKGTDLFIPRDALPEIEEDGEYYVEDLVGLEAINEAGKHAGTVIAVHNFGAGDLLEIKPKSGETYLLPFTDDYVPEVGEDNVTVIPLEHAQ